MTEKRRDHIFISEQEHGLPYSKGLTASSLMVTGLGPVRSYRVANAVEERLTALDDVAFQGPPPGVVDAVGHGGQRSGK